MSQLHKIIVVGAGLGLTKQLAALFPEPAQTKKQLTDRDHDALARAEAKRVRRANRLKEQDHE